MLDYIEPKRLHEDNLKAELHHICRSRGLYLVLEYSLNSSIFDAVFVREGKILAIIEVKRWSLKAARQHRENILSPQIRKYAAYGVPIAILWDFAGVEPLVTRLEQLACWFDSGERGVCKKGKLVYYPKIKQESTKKKRKIELNKIVKQQANDMKLGDRVFNRSGLSWN